jgi:hypothetical protein
MRETAKSLLVIFVSQSFVCVLVIQLSAACLRNIWLGADFDAAAPSESLIANC